MKFPLPSPLRNLGPLMRGTAPAQLVLLILLLLGAPACGGRGPEPADSPPDPRTERWKDAVQPVLAGYCVGCHSEPDPEGSLDLQALTTQTVAPEPAELRARTAFFERMVSHVSGGQMPPPDEPAPDEEARNAFAGWFEEQIAAAWEAAPLNPGRVTVRRLSRFEYGNTVRDLLGVPVDVRKLLPPDEVGYGFDHIGDVLSMPPLLFEKYLGAAEQVASEAVVVIYPEQRAPRRTPGAELEITSGRGRSRGTIAHLFSNGSASRSLDVPQDGTYWIRVEASEDAAGGEPARLEIRDGARVLRSVAVDCGGDDPKVFDIKARLARGHHVLGAFFTNDYFAPKHKDPAMRGDRNLRINWMEVEGPLDLGTEPLSERHALLFPCDPTGSDEACLEQCVRTLLARAFRRPPEQAEVTRHLGLLLGSVEGGDGVAAGMQSVVEAVLVSPHFLFRIESGAPREDALPPAAGGLAVEALGDHALATRLAYFLWSSMPDASLRALADAGRLRERLHQETVRMLADPKASALVSSFAVQWLELQRLDRAAPDPRQFKTFTEGLRRDMRAETELFVETILKEDRSIRDLIDAPFTFLNERLARHYGIEGVEGTEMRRVDLSGSARGGLLTQGSILTLTSYPTRTSVVQRGKWLMQEILGTPPPPPPPGVGTLEEQSPEMLKLSLRERLAVHRENAECAVCHDVMDNLGYGLEHFDAVGAWRTRDGMNDVDSRGVLPDGRSFDGPRALKRLLRDDPLLPRCFARKLLTYALGRGLEPYDRPAVDAIVQAAAAKDYRFSSFVHAIVASAPFTMRTRSGGTK